MKENVYAPAPRTEFVELARSPKGKLYRKQILKFGAFAHPNDPKDKLVIDKALGRSLVKNFHDGVCDIVQTPIVDGGNRHTEDPLRNLGEVIDLSLEEDGIYATIDARKKEYADELGKTLIGASAMMSTNYTDTRTGEKVGPTLLHVAITNRPYITNLKDFEEIISASADTTLENVEVLRETEEEQVADITKEQAILALSNEGIDVEKLLAIAEKAEQAPAVSADDIVVSLSKVLADAGVTVGADTEEEEISLTDVAEAVIEVAQEKVELANTVEELKRESDALKLSRAEDEIERLIGEGKILPAKREVMLKLSISDRDTFEELLPDQPLVSLSEEGVTTHDQRDSATQTFHSEETERLLKLANTLTGNGGK